MAGGRRCDPWLAIGEQVELADWGTAGLAENFAGGDLCAVTDGTSAADGTPSLNVGGAPYAEADLGDLRPTWTGIPAAELGVTVFRYWRVDDQAANGDGIMDFKTVCATIAWRPEGSSRFFSTSMLTVKRP